MTDQNKTKLVVLVDRSGSMERTKADMEGGFTKFIADQRKLPGECSVSLYQFDSTFETVFENLDIHNPKTQKLEIHPRGQTALLDAIGLTIGRVGEQLRALAEHERPGAVIVMIITDGHENASREHTYESVKAKIEEQHDKYSWQFVYLGSDLSTHAEAVNLGIRAAGLFQNNTRGIDQMYTSSSRGVSDYRKGVQMGLKASLHVDANMAPPPEKK